MTETEWLTSIDPEAMLKTFTERQREGRREWTSSRKLRLFCVASIDAILGHGRGCKYEQDGMKGSTDLQWATGWVTRKENCGQLSLLSMSSLDVDGIRADILREIIGNPFNTRKPTRTARCLDSWWTDHKVLRMAHTIYEGRDFAAMPVLADALDDAGCTDEDILQHCRQLDTPHVRGCWVLDLILGKE